jgi:indole-3-glycerol phosphate synthase
MILDQIVADKRLEIAESKARLPLGQLRRRAEAAPTGREFAGALGGERVALIAEIKPASPSRGELRAEVNPLLLARLYAGSGAAAISVLTDHKYFGGSIDNLQAARRGCEAPLLRKDFIVDEYQVYESRALQSDAILLIVRLLDDSQLRDYRLLAESMGMAALVEVHDIEELDRALASGARLIGINNRNLADLTTDLATTERLGPLVPTHHLIVAESGIFTRADVARAASAGAAAVLVGEALMRAGDVAAKVRDLAGVPRYER